MTDVNSRQHMTISAEELAELGRLAEAAEPGIWRARGKRVVTPADYGVVTAWAVADAAYIAYANPERIARLVAECERLRGIERRIVSHMERLEESQGIGSKNAGDSPNV